MALETKSLSKAGLIKMLIIYFTEKQIQIPHTDIQCSSNTKVAF